MTISQNNRICYRWFKNRAKTPITLSCLEIYLIRIVWKFGVFENNSGIIHSFSKYLKESCGLNFVQHFFFKCFRKISYMEERCYQNSQQNRWFWVLSRGINLLKSGLWTQDKSLGHGYQLYIKWIEINSRLCNKRYKVGY